VENSFSSHDNGRTTSQEIPRLLENIQGDDIYKRLHIKNVNTIFVDSIYQQS